MTNDRKKPSEHEVSNLLGLALGPVEEWDESDVDFVLRVKGIDPARSAGRLATLVEQEIKNLKEQGDKIPAKLSALHASLRKEARAMGPLPEAREKIRALFSFVASPKAHRTVQVYGRRVKKLTDADKKILDELAAELLKENEKTESFDQ